MQPPKPQISLPPERAERAEPRFAPTLGRAAARLVVPEPERSSAPRPAKLPRLELVAGERIIIASGGADSARERWGSGILVKAALLLIVAFALFGAATLLRPFVGL